MASRLRRVLLGLLPAAAVLAACGGTVETGGDGGGGHGGSMNHHDSGQPPDATMADSSGSDTATGSDSPPMMDAPPARDVSVEAGGIPCGTTNCDPESQTCCLEFMTGTRSCVAKAACNDGGLSITCSSPASCPTGDVCCASYSGGGIGGAKVSCTSPSACMGFELCETKADCPSDEICEMSPFMGFKICRHSHDGGFGPPDGGFVPPDAGTKG